MRIAIGVHQFLPKYFAGTENLTYRTAKALRKLGHEIIIITGHPLDQYFELDDDVRFDEYTYDGFKIYRFLGTSVPMGDQVNWAEIEYKNNLFEKQFYQQLKTLNVDIAHFFHFTRLTPSLLNVCKTLRIPSLMTATDFWMICHSAQLMFPGNEVCHGPAPDRLNCIRHFLNIDSKIPNESKDVLKNASDEELRTFISLAQQELPFSKAKSKFPNMKPQFFQQDFEYALKAIYKRPDYLKSQMNLLNKVIMPTKLMERVFSEHGLSPEKQYFLPYGLDLEGLIQKTDRGSRQQLTIGFIGSILPTKGVHVLLKAMQRITEYNDIALMIYGDINQDQEYFSELSRIAGSDKRIKFCNTFEPSKIWEVLDGLDVLVVPSTWHENAPLVLLSAQAAKCPVIATNFDGMSEVIKHNHNGLLINCDDDADLAQCLIKLLNDRTLLSNFSSNAIKPFSLDDYADRLESLYHEIISQYHATGKPHR